MELLTCGILSFFTIIITKTNLVFSEKSSVSNLTSTPRPHKPEVLNMCILMETNTVGSVYDYKKLGAAFDLALDYANESILPSWLTIRKLYRNIGNTCSTKTSIVGHAMAFRDSGIDCHAYIGPGCGLAAEVFHSYADFFNKAIFGVPCAGLGLSAPFSEFPLVTRVSYSYTAIAKIILRFLIANKYTTPVFFQDSTVRFFAQMSQLIESTVRQSTNKALKQNSRFVPFTSSSFAGDAEIRTMLTTASLRSRVFILIAAGDFVRKIMIVASKLRMTSGEYVFLAMELYQSDVWGSFSYKRQNSDDSIARQAFKTLLLLSLKIDPGRDVAIFMEKYLKLAREKYKYFSVNTTQGDDPVIYHSFDAVVLYAKIIREMAAAGEDYHSGYDISGKSNGFSFISPVSGKVDIDVTGDRSLHYVIRSFDASSGIHAVALGFPPNSNAVKVLGKIAWPGTNNTGFPPNTPWCGFRGEYPRCIPKKTYLTKSQVTAAVIVPLLLAGIMGICGYRAIKKFILRHTNPFWWRIIKQDLIMQIPGKTSLKTMNSGVLTPNAKEHETKPANSKPETPHVLTAVYDGATVSVLPLNEPQRVTGSINNEAARIRNLMNLNIQKFIGVTVNEENLCESIVAELCQKGSLHNIILDTRLDFDLNFQYSLMRDIVNGMSFLHTTAVVSHGFLNDKTCQIDNRFLLKISEYGLESLRSLKDLEAVAPVTQNRDYRILLWRAPELLRSDMPPAGTQKGDVYSFGILMQQIILRSEPFQMSTTDKHHHHKHHEALTHEEIILDVRRGLIPPLRPPVPMSTCSNALHSLMNQCWDENPLLRHPFARIKNQLHLIIGKSLSSNIFDSIIKKLDSHTNVLEQQIKHQCKLYLDERHKWLNLMEDILPPTIVKALAHNQTVKPETFDCATIYFGDIPDLRDDLAKMLYSPAIIIALLNKLDLLFHETIHKFDVVKIGWDNGLYMIASGLPVANDDKHVEQIASMALSLRKDVPLVHNGIVTGGKPIKIRAGVHSGFCTAGIVGEMVPHYFIFGETVNMARKLTSSGDVGKIHCSLSFRTLLDKFDDFVITPSGRKMQSATKEHETETFWLIGKS